MGASAACGFGAIGVSAGGPGRVSGAVLGSLAAGSCAAMLTAAILARRRSAASGGETVLVLENKRTDGLPARRAAIPAKDGRRVVRYHAQHSGSPRDDAEGPVAPSPEREPASVLLAHCDGRIDRVLVTAGDRRGSLPLEALLHLRLEGVPVETLAALIERETGRVAIDQALPSDMAFGSAFADRAGGGLGKRAFDLIVAAILVVACAPLAALIALAIRAGGRGPLLYRQRRVGWRGREFEMLKFRSMVVDAEGESGPAWCASRDPRVTRVGRVLRRCHLDELPQLVNVLRGEMSLVGPRPERPCFVRSFQGQIPFYRLRHAVRPGITGWAQIHYGYGRSLRGALRKLEYDLFYLKHGSVVLDLRILLVTLLQLLPTSKWTPAKVARV